MPWRRRRGPRPTPKTTCAVSRCWWSRTIRSSATRHTLPEALGLLGVQVTICLQADEALDRLARQSFDAMVSDIRFPGPMDGIDLARTVARRYPALPVPLITGFGSTRRETADFVVLRKPVRLPVLANAIHTGVAAQNSSSGAAGE